MMTFAEYNARLCNKDLQEFFKHLLLEREKLDKNRNETAKDIIAELQGIVLNSNLDGKTVIELREQNKIAANLAEQGKIEESIATIQQILRIYPEHYSAFYTLGSISFGLGNISEALERFKEAFEYNPFFIDAVLRIFDCSVCLGDTSHVSVFLNKALTMQPNDPELLETKRHLENFTYPEHLAKHIQKSAAKKGELENELLKLKKMLESGNSEEALKRLKSLV
jgi:tetratricopeptide (TPR) repeat protein